ncbi:hypothetical protein ACHAXN_007845 [Cyclotella atomus]
MIDRNHLLRPIQSQPRQHRQLPSLLLTLLLTITVHLGSAFIPFIHHPSVSAMSTDSSCSKNNAVHPASSASAASEPNSNEQANSNKDEQTEEILALPESSGDPDIPVLNLGDTMSFEAMGPVIINADGSTRRIDNWDEMSKQEQEVAWRRISKRNAERRAALLEQQQQEQQQDKDGK